MSCFPGRLCQVDTAQEMSWCLAFFWDIKDRNSPFRSSESEPPSLLSMYCTSFWLREYLFTKSRTAPTEEMERDPTGPESPCLFQTFLATLPHLSTIYLRCLIWRTNCRVWLLPRMWDVVICNTSNHFYVFLIPCPNHSLLLLHPWGHTYLSGGDGTDRLTPKACLDAGK